MLKTTKWWVLGWSGALPFIALLILSLWPVIDIAWPPTYMFILYSACILSFLSGSIWRPESSANYSIPTLSSNFITLVAFAAALLNSKVSLLLLCAGYLAIIFIEFRYELFEKWPSGYKSMRVRLTVLVALTHLFLFFF